MAPRVTLLPSSLLLTAVACAPAPLPSSTPETGAPALTAETSPHASASPSPKVDLASITIDGIRLGAPMGEVLARAPYTSPCDIDPIDQSRATLYSRSRSPVKHRW